VLISTHLLWPIYIEEHLQELGNSYAITKMNYAVGALFAGFFISIIFRKASIITSIIVLMILGFIGFITLASFKSVLILYFVAIFLGVSNAGLRIQRITYLFNHIPNHIIGRTNSVFQSINILLRSIFIGIFSITFFSEGSNITWAYWLAAAITIFSLIPLVYNYKKLKGLKIK
jgi:MFS family permease